MFDRLVTELEAIVVCPKSDKDFYITKQEFDDFCKGFLFEELKGNNQLGIAFCKKYNQSNFILSILSNKLARNHIETFYIK